MQMLPPTNGVHEVFLVDQAGICQVFSLVKERLTAEAPLMLSILCYSSGQDFCFRKELEILQRLFPVRLFVHFEPSCFEGHWIFEVDSVNAVIRANTLPKMRFLVSGNDTFVSKAKELLYFLGMDDVRWIGQSVAE